MRLLTVLAFAFSLTVPVLAAGADEQRVDGIFAAYDKPGSPGCALGVIRDGAFIYRKGYGGASLCNLSSADPGELSRKVADIYLSKDLQTTTAPMLPSGSETFSDLGPFAGKYRNPSDHSVLSFTVSGGSLAALGRTFRHTGTTRFEGSGAIITFDNSIGPTTVTIDRAGENFFTGTRFEEVHVADAALADYAGTYTSTELDASYRLAVANGSLMLRMNWNRPLRLNPLTRDEFETGSLGTLVFQRDAKDRILSLRLFAGRVRNITFEKTH